MTTYGVTDTGFVAKPFEAIQAELEQDLAGAFGAGIDLTPQSVFGQLVGIVAERYADLWQLSEAVYGSAYPDSASGSSLDNVSAISGTQRLPAKYSTVRVNLTGTPGAVIPTGRVFSVTTSGAKFVTVAAVTLDGSGNATGVLAVAQQTGAIPAAAGTLTVIETPTSGLATVTNPLDATLGQDLETDAALRARREQNLRAEGNAALEAIREKVAAVAGVTACKVFENVGDTVDADGRPGHCVEVLVQGGADADIRAAIIASEAASVQTFGSVTGTVVDSEGFSHTINFNRPTVRNVYVVIDLTKDPATWPVTGVADTQAAVATKGDARQTIGANLITSRISPDVFGISGVTDVTAVYVGTAPAPASSANLVAGVRDLFDFDTSRITVNAT
jgi:uncharacterized phage protein gp47/JayE